VSERNLLASCIASREAFDSVSDLLNEGDVSEQGNIILSHVREYYDRDPEAAGVDAELLSGSVRRSLSNPKHRETFETLIRSLTAADVSPKNVLHDFKEVRREAAGDRLASALAARADVAKVSELVEEYQKWDQFDVEDVRDTPSKGRSITDLVVQQQEKGLIEIWPQSLNNRLDGGLLPGHHMLIFARPEMGKTMMLVNMMAGFLAQNLTVLYCGNEDPQDEIILRLVSRLTGMTRYEIFDDPDLADQLARESGYDNIVFADMAPGTPREIQRLVDEYDADVVLIDQLRNINVREDQFVQKLEKAATAARLIAKANNVLVVSVTQAGDSATGKGPLDMGDVDSSNTGIPAQVDVMVGIGATAEDESTNRRILSLPKNKRSGRHEFWPVGVEPQLSKMRSLG
jgi:archaellum biogenesis ATPase FlaH